MEIKYTKLMATLALAGMGMVLVRSSAPLQVKPQAEIKQETAVVEPVETPTEAPIETLEESPQTNRVEIEIGGVIYLVDEKSIIESPPDVYETSSFLQEVEETIKNYEPISFLSSFLEMNRINLQDKTLRFDPNDLFQVQACVDEYIKVYETLEKDEDSLRFQYLYYPKRDEGIDFDESIQKNGVIEYLALNESYLTQETKAALLEKYQIKEDEIPSSFVNERNCDPLLIRPLVVESGLYDVLGIEVKSNSIDDVLNSVNAYYEARELGLDERLLTSLELVIQKGNEKYLNQASVDQNLSVRDRYYFSLLPELKKQTDFEGYRSRVLQSITGKELETYNNVK